MIYTPYVKWHYNTHTRSLFFFTRPSFLPVYPSASSQWQESSPSEDIVTENCSSDLCAEFRTPHSNTLHRTEPWTQQTVILSTTLASFDRCTVAKLWMSTMPDCQEIEQQCSTLSNNSFILKLQYMLKAIPQLFSTTWIKLLLNPLSTIVSWCKDVWGGRLVGCCFLAADRDKQPNLLSPHLSNPLWCI